MAEYGRTVCIHPLSLNDISYDITNFVDQVLHPRQYLASFYDILFFIIDVAASRVIYQLVFANQFFYNPAYCVRFEYPLYFHASRLRARHAASRREGGREGLLMMCNRSELHIGVELNAVQRPLTAANNGRFWRACSIRLAFVQLATHRQQYYYHHHHHPCQLLQQWRWPN